jgi:hypothetical protein
MEDLVNSKITSRAACLAELTSNPKSFFNCPDMHGGPGLLEGRFRSGEMDPETLERGKRKTEIAGTAEGSGRAQREQPNYKF